jgi:hypothetical protein
MIMRGAPLIIVFSLTLTNTAWATALSDKYQYAMDLCAGRVVANLDDGISSAEVVANVLLQECKGENWNLWEALSKSQSKDFVTAFGRLQLTKFTAHVLYNRAAQRKNSKVQ